MNNQAASYTANKNQTVVIPDAKPPSRLAERRSKSAIQYKPQHRRTHKKCRQIRSKADQWTTSIRNIAVDQGEKANLYAAFGGTVWSGSNALQTRRLILEFSSVMIWLFEMTCTGLTKSTQIDWDDHANK